MRLKNIDKAQKSNLIFILFFFLMTFLMLNGCATTAEVKDSKESLRGIADDYWKKRLADKYDETYKMEDKSGLPAFNEYQNQAMALKKFNIISIVIKEITVETVNGMVDVEISFIMPMASTIKPFKQIIKDKWIYKDGMWWHIM